MSSKISALPAATTASNFDLLTSVQGGVNKKVTKQTLLQGAPGEDIGLQGVFNNAININSAGGVGIAYNDGEPFIVETVAGLHFIEVDAGGAVLIASPTGNNFALGTVDGALQFVVGGGAAISCTMGHSVLVQYAPANVLDWVGPPPTTLSDAIDRLARVVSVSGTVPIP